MPRGALRLIGVFALLALSISLTRASDADDLFTQAVRLDIEGDAKNAFELYLRAAEHGSVKAEFNVAAMLDSGRGTNSDVAQAAIWYARAASHGNQRAAYNLGQLYALGQGVPSNSYLANAWFEACKLEAARGRLVPEFSKAGTSIFSMPKIVAPSEGERVNAEIGGAELVWTSEAQREPVRYFLEVRLLTQNDSKQMYLGYVDTSSLFVTLPSSTGEYAWQVVAVARKSMAYYRSKWMHFSVSQQALARGR